MTHAPQDYKPNPEIGDRVIWVPAATDGRFSVSSAWRTIRSPNPKVPWGAVAWFHGNVPRWAFIVWLCCWGRLATSDRLQEWVMGETSFLVVLATWERRVLLTGFSLIEGLFGGPLS